MKEPGYYWVQLTPNSDWEIAYYIGGKFQICNFKYKESEISFIYLDRIKNPYESKEN
jgi:hypothetical protein